MTESLAAEKRLFGFATAAGYGLGILLLESISATTERIVLQGTATNSMPALNPTFRHSLSKAKPIVILLAAPFVGILLGTGVKAALPRLGLAQDGVSHTLLSKFADSSIIWAAFSLFPTNMSTGGHLLRLGLKWAGSANPSLRSRQISIGLFLALMGTALAMHWPVLLQLALIALLALNFLTTPYMDSPLFKPSAGSLQLQHGYISPDFATVPERLESVLVEPYILICEKPIVIMNALLPVLQDTLRAGRPPPHRHARPGEGGPGYIGKDTTLILDGRGKRKLVKARLAERS